MAPSVSQRCDSFSFRSDSNEKCQIYGGSHIKQTAKGRKYQFYQQLVEFSKKGKKGKRENGSENKEDCPEIWFSANLAASVRVEWRNL